MTEPGHVAAALGRASHDRPAAAAPEGDFSLQLRRLGGVMDASINFLLKRSTSRAEQCTRAVCDSPCASHAGVSLGDLFPNSARIGIVAEPSWVAVLS